MVPYEGQQEAMNKKRAYEAYALRPAGIAPPGIDTTPRRADGDGIWGMAAPIRAEEESWNQWPDGSARLFNNRMAHLFEVSLQGDGLIGWVPEDTSLELNDPSIRLISSGSPEGLLVDLLYFAKTQEDWILDGDLVARTRAAGAFRSSYMPARGSGRIDGIIGFPISSLDAPMEVADTHIVAERLTVSVTTAQGIRTLVWVFD